MNPWTGLLNPPKPYEPRQEINSRTSRVYCAKRLLEHGRLDLPEFREITGWSTSTAAMALYQLAEKGEVRRIREPGTRRYLYELVS